MLATNEHSVNTRNKPTSPDSQNVDTPQRYVTSQLPTSLGSLRWSEYNGGALCVRERRALRWAAKGAELGYIARRIKATLERSEPALAQVPLPNTALAGTAQSLCEHMSTPAMVRHCLRSYLWGALLGQRMQLQFDAELLFVANMLHGLGLTEYARPSSEVPCFAVSGARAAHAFLLTEHVPETRALAVADSICQLINPAPWLSRSALTQLLAAGFALDTIGVRKHELSASLRAEVLRQQPRGGFAAEFGCSLGAHINSWPNTRSAVLERYCQLLRRIARGGV